MLLFVYGTMLRRGHNHRRLYDLRAIYIGDFETKDPFKMYIRKRGGVPLGVRDPDAGWPIAGELYAVDDEVIDKVDACEGHPTVYERQLVTLRDFNEANTLQVSAYVYVGDLTDVESEVEPEIGVLHYPA